MTDQNIRVLVVDDSLLFRMTMREALVKIDGIEVIDSASNGREALEKIEAHDPDLLTLDIQMPDVDGIEVLRQIRQQGHRTRAIMVSSLTASGAQATTDSLLEGAFDFILKPAGNNLKESVSQLRSELREKIKAFRESREARVRDSPSRHKATRSSAAATATRTGKRRVVVIGCSTGGPEALREILPALPAGLPVPILVAQHMPAQFTAALARRLNDLCQLSVSEASDGTTIRPGHVLIAPGGMQMCVRSATGEHSVATTDDPPEHGCRPSVDYLLRSVADVYGGAALAVILTGMGKDGTAGCRQLKQCGALVLTQDEQSSIVFGMPNSVQQADLSDATLPLKDVASEIARLCQ